MDSVFEDCTRYSAAAHLRGALALPSSLAGAEEGLSRRKGLLAMQRHAGPLGLAAVAAFAIPVQAQTGIGVSVERAVSVAVQAGMTQRSMARTWTGVGLMAAGTALALTGGTDCRLAGEFDTYQVTFLGSIELTGENPIWSSDCVLTDFTITGTVFSERVNLPASSADEDARAVIQGDAHGEEFRKPGYLYGGIALITTGALLATIWADTTVAERLSFTPMRGGGHLRASFGF